MWNRSSVDRLAELRTLDQTLVIQNLHGQGLRPGALGRAGLNAIAQEIMRQVDVDDIVIFGAIRTGAARASALGQSGSNEKSTLMLRQIRTIQRPGDPAKTLKRRGLNMRDAHAVLNGLVAGHQVAVPCHHVSRAIIDELQELGVQVHIDEPSSLC